MHVGAILDEKGRTVFTIGADQTLLEATAELRDRSIGAVVVTNSAGVSVGILSERDIVRALANHGASVLDRPVHDFMTENVFSCSETDMIDTVMETMTTRRFRHLPVLRDGELVGLISIGDAVRVKIAQIEAEAEELKSYINNAG